MAKRKLTNDLPTFGLPYPMASAVGRQRATELINAYADQLGKLYVKAMQFGAEEIGTHADTMVDLYGRAMNPAEQTLSGAKGMMGVYTAGLLGYAEREIADHRNALAALMNKGQLPSGRFMTGPQGGVPSTTYGRPLPLPGTDLPVPQPKLIGPLPEPGGPGYPSPYPPGCPPQRPILIEPIRPPGGNGQPCPPTVINLSCPQCGGQQQCNWNLNILAQAIATAINQVMVILNVSQWQEQSQSQQQSLINQITQSVSVTLPPQPEPPEQLGRDCGHAIHICLCGSPTDPRCLGSAPDIPLWVQLSIDQGPLPLCPAPLPSTT